MDTFVGLCFFAFALYLFFSGAIIMGIISFIIGMAQVS